MLSPVLPAHGGYATLKMPEKSSTLPVLSLLGGFGLQWGFRKTDWLKLVNCVVALLCCALLCWHPPFPLLAQRAVGTGKSWMTLGPNWISPPTAPCTPGLHGETRSSQKGWAEGRGDGAVG